MLSSRNARELSENGLKETKQNVGPQYAEDDNFDLSQKEKEEFQNTGGIRSQLVMIPQGTEDQIQKENRED